MTRWRGRYAVPALGILVLCAGSVPFAHAAGCKDQTPTSWDIVVASRSEPGERLIVTGRVVLRGNTPVPGATVYIYHADQNGDYARKGHEKEYPRLCGILRTNDKGEYRLETSMPGGYEGYLPHVHFEVWGPGLKRTYLFVNLRRMDTGKDTIRTATLFGPPLREDRTAIERPVTRGPDGKLHCTRDLIADVK